VTAAAASELAQLVLGLERERDALRDQNARLERLLGQARRRLAELTPVHVATERLHGSLDRKQVLLALEETLASIVGCEQWAVFELAGSPEALTFVAAVGLPAVASDSTHPGAERIAHSFATGETWVAEPGEPAPGDEPPLTACVPLKVDGRVTGLLALYRMLEHKGVLETADLPLLETLAAHAAVALAGSRLAAVEAAR
jgi:GAF domain-containing protein